MYIYIYIYTNNNNNHNTSNNNNIHIYIYTYIYICICVCMYIYIYIYICIHIYIYIYVYIYSYTIGSNILKLTRVGGHQPTMSAILAMIAGGGSLDATRDDAIFLSGSASAVLLSDMYTCMYKYVYVYTYIYIYTYTHIIIWILILSLLFVLLYYITDTCDYLANPGRCDFPEWVRDRGRRTYNLMFTIIIIIIISSSIVIINIIIIICIWLVYISVYSCYDYYYNNNS